MRVLLSSASFALGYGGPANSVYNLAKHLAGAGLDVALWSPDGTALRAVSIWGRPGDKVVALAGTLNDVMVGFGIPDIFHDSGLWWRHNAEISSLANALGRPSVVSIRGMLEPSALNHHRWRKRLAWYSYQRRNLSRSSALHVTGEVEAEHVRAFQIPTRVVRIPNGIDLPKELPVRTSSRTKRVIFLGRLHPIKGLPMLLEAWKHLRPTDWHLEIAGPDEGGHLRRLQDQVRQAGIGASVSFSGPLYGEAKSELFRRAAVLVLPSFSENFGHAAAEALANGVPVIATSNTPWGALEIHACGWHVATSVHGLAEGLKKAITTHEDDLAAMGRRGRAYVAEAFSWPHIADRMSTLYRELLVERS